MSQPIACRSVSFVMFALSSACGGASPQTLSGTPPTSPVAHHADLSNPREALANASPQELSSLRVDLAVVAALGASPERDVEIDRLLGYVSRGCNDLPPRERAPNEYGSSSAESERARCLEGRWRFAYGLARAQGAPESLLVLLRERAGIDLESRQPMPRERRLVREGMSNAGRAQTIAAWRVLSQFLNVVRQSSVYEPDSLLAPMFFECADVENVDSFRWQLDPMYRTDPVLSHPPTALEGACFEPNDLPAPIATRYNAGLVGGYAYARRAHAHLMAATDPIALALRPTVISLAETIESEAEMSGTFVKDVAPNNAFDDRAFQSSLIHATRDELRFFVRPRFKWSTGGTEIRGGLGTVEFPAPSAGSSDLTSLSSAVPVLRFFADIRAPEISLGDPGRLPIKIELIDQSERQALTTTVLRTILQLSESFRWSEGFAQVAVDLSGSNSLYAGYLPSISLERLTNRNVLGEISLTMDATGPKLLSTIALPSATSDLALAPTEEESVFILTLGDDIPLRDDRVQELLSQVPGAVAYFRFGDADAPLPVDANDRLFMTCLPRSECMVVRAHLENHDASDPYLVMAPIIISRSLPLQLTDPGETTIRLKRQGGVLVNARPSPYSAQYEVRSSGPLVTGFRTADPSAPAGTRGLQWVPYNREVARRASAAAAARRVR